MCSPLPPGVDVSFRFSSFLLPLALVLLLLVRQRWRRFPPPALRFRSDWCLPWSWSRISHRCRRRLSHPPWTGCATYVFGFERGTRSQWKGPAFPFRLETPPDRGRLGSGLEFNRTVPRGREGGIALESTVESGRSHPVERDVSLDRTRMELGWNLDRRRRPSGSHVGGAEAKPRKRGSRNGRGTTWNGFLLVQEHPKCKSVGCLGSRCVPTCVCREGLAKSIPASVQVGVDPLSRARLARVSARKTPFLLPQSQMTRDLLFPLALAPVRIRSSQSPWKVPSVLDPHPPQNPSLAN